MRKSINILVCGEGGHYSELMRLYIKLSSVETFSNCDDFIVLTSSTTSQIKLNHIYIKELRDKSSNIKTALLLPYVLIYNLIVILYCFLMFRVNSIISTGPGTSIIPIALGKLFRCKTVHIETMCKFESISTSGKVIKIFSDIFIVQNKELMSESSRTTRYGGRL